jgi:O-antigen ligase
MTRSFAMATLDAPETPQDRRGSVPIIAVVALLVYSFLHEALAPILPRGATTIMLAAVVVATIYWMDRSSTPLLGIGAIEIAFASYLLWNLYSMIAPHEYPATDPLTAADLSVPRFIMSGIGTPFLLYVVGRYMFERVAAVTLLLWTILALASYSAWVSILQFTGPTEWVWPRFIVDGSLEGETWTDRAIGVFNQPVVNGLILALGFAIAMWLMTQKNEPAYRRLLAIAIAVGCGYALYLTHTRAAWLSGAVVLILGVLLAHGFRKPSAVALGFTAMIVAINWSVFTSSDRDAGGVGSVGEIHDRLNSIQTALWAFTQKPFEGWGISRFIAVNTYHHQQWSPDVPFERGYAISVHTNELGILAELGLIGLLLWIALLVLIAYRLYDAYRTLPANELCGKPLAIVAIMAFAAMVCTGLTVDLRYFSFATGITFLLVGIVVGWTDRHRRTTDAEQVEVGKPNA